MKVCIRIFNLHVYGEVDGEWQTTEEVRADEWYEVDGHFEESDIDAIRLCVFCFASGDDLYESKMAEALAHTEVVESPEFVHIRLGVELKEREIFEGDDKLPSQWMVAG